MTRRLLLLPLLGLLAAAASGEPASPAGESPPAEDAGAAAEPSFEEWAANAPFFSGEAESVLVEVPVEVLSGGQPLEGLTAENFEIFDNGRRQKILGVEAVDRRLGSYDDSLPVVARRHFLLVFDLSFTSPAAVARAREAALRTVETQLDPSDLVGVATFRLQEGVRLLLGFSPDRRQVRVTLDALERKSRLALRPDPLNLYLGQPASADGGLQAPLRPDAPNVREEAYAHLQHLIDRESAARSRRDVALFTESLASLARLLRGAAGRKHLLLFSEGFGTGLLHGSDGADRESLDRAIRQGDLAKVDSDAMFGSRATIDLLTRLTEEMRRADCSLHTVDTSPLGQGQGKEGLFLLARDTGAVFFENFNRLEEAFDQLLRRTRLTYVVTYRPDDLAGDGSYRKLKVKVAGGAGQDGSEIARAKLSYRPGYYDDELDSFAKEQRRLLLADRLLDRRPGAIKTRVHALPTADLVHGKRFVPVVVEVGGPSFLGAKAPGAPENGRQVVVDAQVFVYALDEQGGIADFFSQAIPFDLTRHGPALQRRGFKLFAPLLLPTGRFTLRALVRNGEGGQFGVASRQLQVAKKASALRVPPALVDPEWLLVRADRSDLEDLGPDRDTLELLRKAQFQPAPSSARPAAPPAAESSAPYLRALAAFGEKPWHEALDALEAFELRTAGDDPQNRAPRLGRAELAAARAIPPKDAEAFWPLLVAHHDLYFRHRKGHRPYLELQSRQLVRSLADLAAERGDETLRLAAAQALASIGSALLYEGRAAGFELLERSLALDPLNEPAHLALAAYYEKFGGPYERAVEWLDQLVLRRPDSREGRLRLAINLGRLAGPAAASWPQAAEDTVRHFERLIDDPQNDWISSLAVQELARVHRAEPEQAAALLEDALGRRPGDAEILVQLAYFYDRLGRSEKSRNLAELLGAAVAGGADGGADAGPSPRGKYNQWSSEPLAAARRELQQGALGRLAALRQALPLGETPRRQEAVR